MNYLNMLLMCAGAAQPAAEGAEGTGQNGTLMIIIYVVIFAAFIYFIMIRPSRKQKKQQEETYSSMQPGDSVLTTSGFYGTIVAVNGDTVIVEFGNNKNCRIPMAKQAISQVEKAGSAGQAASADASPVKKFFGKRKEKEQIEDTTAADTSSESSSDGSSEESSENNAE